MNYNNDRPIYTSEQDLLGRASFSKCLGKSIYSYNGSEGLIIGLFGKWGTGKTSVINMAINEIEFLAEGEENKPLIIKFAPWNYSDKDNLISIFFQNLKNKIRMQKNENVKKDVGKALNDYAGAFDALNLVPGFGPSIAAILKTFARGFGKDLMQGADLDQTKEKLRKALIKANTKIIIIIDDIDRLTNSQIRDVFQLVKQVADFPNVIYVLAMDRDVVGRALTEVHNIDGNEYLEKIIQVPFEIPELRRSKLNEIFLSRLSQVVDDIQNKLVLDDEYWSHVFRNCIEPYINTLRDVNRVINTFQFRYGAMYHETSFEDMIAITTIEVLEPQLYSWISGNKESVCGGFMHGLAVGSGNKIDYRKQYSEEFEKIGINSEKAISFVSTLFPVFAKDVKEHQYSYRSISNIREKMRAACEERFELYFMFDLDDIKVPRSVIDSCIYKFDESELAVCMRDLNKQGSIVYFLDEVGALIDKIPDNRLGIIASAMMSVQGEFQSDDRQVIFMMPAIDKAEYCVIGMIEKLRTEEERFDIISSIVENANFTNLGTAAHIINRIELAYARLAGKSEDREDQIISLEHLLALEKIYVSKVCNMSQLDSFIYSNKFYMLFYLWKSFDKNGANNYVKNLFSDDIHKIKFVCAFAGKWHGTGGNGWSFNSENYSEYISNEEIYNIIQEYDKTKIDDFTEAEQIKMASFILNYKKSDMYHVNENDALKLVEEWKMPKK